MQQSNQKGHWETVVPGYYEYVYRKPYNTPYGQQGWREGWYKVWEPPKREWVGPKPRTYIMGWCAVVFSIALLFSSALFTASYTNPNPYTIIAGLFLLSGGIFMILKHEYS